APQVLRQSAKDTLTGEYDAIVTDPPYYAAIPYSDLMDFFYIWLRRTLHGLTPELDVAFREPLGPKWNSEDEDGEFLDDPGRYGGDKAESKAAYEASMERAFKACRSVLTPQGRLVLVFANKSPDAWEALVAALIRAGFVVDGSWPIQTERGNRTRAHASSALSSSIWLVCKPRPVTRPGWDGAVLDEMRRSIRTRLRHFWDAKIQGPDFVWAAVGPALESYSRYPFVRKANAQNEVLTVKDFLRDVRRLVVEYAVGRVLEVEDADAIDVASGLDPVTAYYLLHRKTFGLGDAPAGACILYAQSCGLEEMALVDKYELTKKSGGKKSSAGASRAVFGDVVREETLDYEIDEADEIEPELEEAAETEGTGSEFKLLPYRRRKRKTLGEEAVGGAPAPMIDQIHRLMQLHEAGDAFRLDAYIDRNGLARNNLLRQVMQAVRQLAEEEDEHDEQRVLDIILQLLQERERSGTPAPPKPVQGVLDLIEA
ncbi:MAG TPA: hypothetical protein VGR43_06395, partial [Dehalococcoidia bacterium]|nr:hypothetical protein [Dehalococcoidia bacterium]